MVSRRGGTPKRLVPERPPVASCFGKQETKNVCRGGQGQRPLSFRKGITQLVASENIPRHVWVRASPPPVDMPEKPRHPKASRRYLSPVYRGGRVPYPFVASERCPTHMVLPERLPTVRHVGRQPALCRFESASRPLSRRRRLRHVWTRRSHSQFKFCWFT